MSMYEGIVNVKWKEVKEKETKKEQLINGLFSIDYPNKMCEMLIFSI